MRCRAWQIVKQHHPPSGKRSQHARAAHAGAAQAQRAGAGEAADLGIYAKSFDPPPSKGGSPRAAIQKNRAERYALLSTARRIFSAAGRRAGLVYGHDYCKTAKCKFISHGQGVGVHKSHQHNGAFYSGLVTCGSVWNCPVCGPKIQERRREEIAKAVDWAYANDLQPVLVTLTFPHYAWNKLSTLLKQQAQALYLLRSGSPWKRFKTAYGYRGLIRSLENLLGRNGWHPHTHELWFVRRDLTPWLCLLRCSSVGNPPAFVLACLTQKPSTA